MGYWSSNWDKPWRDVKQFGEDIYNHARSSYNRNKGSTRFGMPAGYGIRYGAKLIGDAYNRAWDNSHGGDRYWLSQVPILGWAKQLQDKANYYEDYYNHTGIDPKYSQVYGGSAGGLLGDINKQTSALQPRKWARSVEQMFTVQFEENLMK